MGLVLDEEYYLQHFGVKGMRWGVRNEDKSAGGDKAAAKQAKREKKAQKFDARAAAGEKRLSELDSQHPINPWEKMALQNERELIRGDIARQKANAVAKREGKLTPDEKKRLKGAAIAAGILIAYGAYHHAQSGQIHEQALKGRAWLHGSKFAFAKNATLAKPNMSEDEIKAFVVNPINRGYGKFGTKMNCRRCTFAYEMRRRGYDVAATRTTNARGQNISGVFNALHPGVKPVGPGPIGMSSRAAKEGLFGKGKTPFLQALKESGPVSTKTKVHPSGIFDALRQHPNGARGELAMSWHPLGAHSMAWEIVNGKPVIFDTQNGHKYSDAASFASEVGKHIKEVGFTRLDNVPLNEDFLMRWLKNA